MKARRTVAPSRPRAWRLGLALAVGGGGLAVTPGGAAEPVPFRVGFAESIFAEINPNDARAAIKVWAQAVASERRVNLVAVPSVIRGADTMRTELRANRLDAVALPLDEFARVNPESGFSHLFLTTVGGQMTENYVVLVRRNGARQRLADLAGGRVALLRGPRTSLAELWLERELQALGLPPIATHFGQFSRVKKLSQAVLPVFFGQVDAAVVTRQGFKTMVELNPQIGRDLRELAVSPGYVPVVLAVRAGFTPEILPEIVASLREFHTTPSGRQVLLIFQGDQLIETNLAALAESLALLRRTPAAGAVPEAAASKEGS